MLNERLPVGSSFDPSRQDTGVLTRLSRAPFSPHSALTSLQSQVDGLVSHFVQEAANPTTLAALMAGGMAYRFGRIGIMAAGEGRVASSMLQAASVTGGFGLEVGTFELASRTLSSDRNPNRWNWSGQGGWAQGLTTSTITFGMLKGAGYLGREQNLIFQHAFQSTAMVAGHQTAGLFGITARPEGSLAEQFLHAEATNIQLGAGTSLVHSIAPGFSALERGLDLSIQARGGANPLFTRDEGRSQGSPLPQLAMATAETGPRVDGRAMGESPLARPEKNPNLILMSANQGDGGDEGNNPPSGGVRGEFYTRPEPKEGASRKSSTEILRHSLEISWGDLLRLYPHALGVFRLSRGENVFRLVMANDRLNEMFGYTFEEASEMILRDFIHPEDVGQFRERFSNLPTSDRFKVEGVRIRKKDGTVIFCDANVGMGVFDNHHLLFAFLEDVTEKRLNLEALRASEAQKRALINAIPDAIYRVRADGTFLDIHAGQQAVLVLPREELLATRLAHLNLPPPVVQLGLQTVEKALQGGLQAIEFDFPSPEGIRHQEARVVASGPDEVVGIVRDITERKKAEAEMDRLIKVIDASSDYISMATPDGKIFFNNQAGRKLMGLGPEVDLSNRRVSDNHPPWVLELFRKEAIPTAEREGVWVGESALLHRDGHEIPVSQMIIIHRGSDGSVTHYSTIIRDITEMKRAEANRIAAERASATLSAVQSMSEDVAHDLNGYMGYITGSLTTIGRGLRNLIKHPGLSPDLIPTIEIFQRLLVTAGVGADKISELNKELRELNAPPEKGHPFDLNALLRANENQIRESLGPEIQFELNLEAPISQVPGPGARMDRIITNLIQNAKDAMQDREEKRLTIQTRIVEMNSSDFVSLNLNSSEWEMKPGRYLRLSIGDTGLGMSEETRSQIFNRYFSTKHKSHAGHGGLGLAIVRKSVQNVGGFIVVKSVLGQGTTFDIYLPWVDSSVSTETPKI